MFDLAKYRLPAPKDVNLPATRQNVAVFLSAYLSSRCRVGQPREPRVTQSLSLFPPATNKTSFEAEQILIDNEEAQDEFNHLHQLFIKGYAAIQHPSNTDITERRKRIFFDRYIHGYSIYVTAQRSSISEDSVKQESNVIIIEFASALELIVMK